MMPARSAIVVPHDSDTMTILGAVSRARQTYRALVRELVAPTDIVIVAVEKGKGEEAKKAILSPGQTEEDFEVRADPRLGR